MTESVESEMMAPPRSDVLAGDNIPDSNQSLTCFSCDEPLINLYCANCGQKNDNYRRSLWSLGAEAIASLTAVENRIWRTWAALLFKPGKVARQYADGRRTHWSSPVRVYIFMSILLFGYMEVTGTMFFALRAELTPKDGVTKPVEELTADDVTMSISAHWFPRQSEIDAWNAALNFDLLRAKMANDGGGSDFVRGITDGLAGGPTDVDTIVENVSEALAESETLTEGDLQNFRAAMDDVRSALPPDTPVSELQRLDEVIARVQQAYDAQEASEAESDTPPDIDNAPESEPNNEQSFTYTLTPGSTYEVTGGEVTNAFIDYLRNPALGNNILNKWFPRIIFLMMPVSMFLGALFIRGRKRLRLFGKRDPDARRALLYDHLVHAAYIHAVAYLILFLGIIAERLLPIEGGSAGLILIVYMLIYLPISLRRMFDRGWIKTIWTSYGVATLHFMIVVILTTIAITMGLAEQFGEV